MLMKQIVSDGIESNEEYYELFAFNYFKVIILAVDSETEFHTRYTLPERNYMINLVLTLAKDIINSKKGLMCDGFIREESPILIVNSQSAKIEDEEELFGLILSEAYKVLKVSVSIAVGITSEEGGVSNSLESAKEAFLQKYLFGRGNVIFPVRGHDAELNVEFDEDEFINNVKLLNQDAVNSQLAEFTESLKETYNAEFAKEQLWLIVMRLLNYAKDRFLLTRESYHIILPMSR